MAWIAPWALKPCLVPLRFCGRPPLRVALAGGFKRLSALRVLADAISNPPVYGPLSLLGRLPLRYAVGHRYLMLASFPFLPLFLSVHWVRCCSGLALLGQRLRNVSQCQSTRSQASETLGMTIGKTSHFGGFSACLVILSLGNPDESLQDDGRGWLRRRGGYLDT